MDDPSSRGLGCRWSSRTAFDVPAVGVDRVADDPCKVLHDVSPVVVGVLLIQPASAAGSKKMSTSRLMS
jgi:hypothetical protein